MARLGADSRDPSADGGVIREAVTRFLRERRVPEERDVGDAVLRACDKRGAL
jgi:hypothetical protein